MSTLRFRRYKTLVACLLATTIVILLLHGAPVEMDIYDTITPIQYKENLSSFTTILSDHGDRRTRPKIIIWTTFFGSMKWYEESKNVFKNVCNDGCSLTADRSEIESADAVVFHLADITWQGQLQSRSRFTFPTYRRPDQVWLLYNLEPLTMVWGDFGAWQGVFNWTWSYHRGADVYSPYGKARLLNGKEKSQMRERYMNYNFHDNKNMSGAIAMISHCTDDARRYRLIEHINTYIPTQVIGGCGKKCPSGFDSCAKLLSPYRFYMAFENSDCVEYVSEKYWRALMRNQIPIVAWRNSMQDLVIPGSYINLYDFPDLAAAGSYIQEVNRNATLYNSYFGWRQTHAMAGQPGLCSICKALRDPSVPRMVYHDMYGWLSNNTCKQLTIPRLLNRMYDRFMYDYRVV